MKKLLILLTTLLILQGCSFKQGFSVDELQNLTTSVNVENLENASFDTSANKLTINSAEEVVNKEGFDSLLSTLKINNFSGSELSFDKISKQEFGNKNFSIEVVSRNNNSVSFSVQNTEDRTYNINQTKFSDDYVRNVLSTLSKDLVRFDELSGVIETSLSKGRSLDNMDQEFDTTLTKVNADIERIKSLSADNSDFKNIESAKESVARLEELVPKVTSATKLAISSNNGTQIANVFLVVNDIDKIARTLTTL